MGYVGAVSGACLSALGHEVVGVDINPAKVASINSGDSPIVEGQLNNLVGVCVRQGKLRATLDPIDAVLNSDMSFISVGTPSAPNGHQILTAVDAVISDIARALRQKQNSHVVVVRSTVQPGTTEG